MLSHRDRGKFGVVLLFVVAGLFIASDQVAGVLNRPTSRVPHSPHTFWAWDLNWREKATYQLDPEGEKLLTSILERKPDSVINAPIGSVPSGMLTCEGAEYAIDDDQLALLGKNETRVWVHQGIKAILIKESKRVQVPILAIITSSDKS